MWFLFFVLLGTTALLCYAGYIFLIVDKREAKQVLENPEVYEALDDKEYDFELPIEIQEYEELRESKPADKCEPHEQRALPPLRESADARAAEKVAAPDAAPSPPFPASLRRRTLPLALLKRAMADIPLIEVNHGRVHYKESARIGRRSLWQGCLDKPH